MDSKKITSIFYLIAAIMQHKMTYYLFSSTFFIFGITNIGLDVKKDKPDDENKGE